MKTKRVSKTWRRWRVESDGTRTLVWRRTITRRNVPGAVTERPAR